MGERNSEGETNRKSRRRRENEGSKEPRAKRERSSLDTRPNLAPPTHFLVGKFGLALLH